MKIKKYLFFPLFIFSLCCFSQEEPETVLQKADEYFLNITWSESEDILNEPLPEPFAVNDISIKEVSAYADINLTEGIFPSIEGLGFLDYSGIDSSLIRFFNTLSAKIKGQKIEGALCVKEKIFLPFMINYRLKELSDVKNIFFSRPEYRSGNRASAKFRCAKNGESPYFIEITVLQTEDKWLIEAADFIGEDYAEAS